MVRTIENAGKISNTVSLLFALSFSTIMFISYGSNHRNPMVRTIENAGKI
jgi:hypothetical protein